MRFADRAVHFGTSVRHAINDVFPRHTDNAFFAGGSHVNGGANNGFLSVVGGIDCPANSVTDATSPNE